MHEKAKKIVTNLRTNSRKTQKVINKYRQKENESLYHLRTHITEKFSFENVELRKLQRLQYVTTAISLN